MSKVLIIGGGLAGLSCAAYLSHYRHKVHLIEASPKLGGRTYSFLYEKQNDIIDNGQHIMMGCYRSTLDFINLIGSSDKIFIQKKLGVAFVDGNAINYRLQSPNRIYPFNLLSALLNYDAVAFNERLNVLKALFSVLFQDIKKIEKHTLSDWLDDHGQTGSVRKALWDILCVGTLNTNSSKASAAVFVNVLKQIFFKGNKSALIIIPRTGLSEVFSEPASDFIKKNGGEISLSEKIIRVETQKSQITKVVTNKGTLDNFDHVISAVPHYSYSEIFNKCEFSGLPLEYSPIITVHVWLYSNPFRERFYGLINSALHWVFNNENHISLLTSDAAEIVDKTNKEIFSIFIKELAAFFPKFNESLVKDYIVIKEKRATFIPTPDITIRRQKIKSPYSNLILAGDWTDTGLPSTIESAVRSGIEAAKKLIN